MEIKETQEKELQLINESVQGAKRSIRFAQQNLTSLSMGNTPEEMEENGGDPLDPTCFLTAQECAEWNRLSSGQQERFLKEGRAQAERNFRSQGEERETAGAFRKFQKEEREAEDERRDLSHTAAANQRASQSGETYHGQPETPGLSSTQSAQTSVPVETGLSQGATSTASSAAQGAASAGTSTAAAASSGGISLALKAGKKAADSFKQALDSHAMAADQAMSRAQQKLQQTRAENQAIGTLPSGFKYIVATAATAALTVAAVLLHAIVSMVGALLAMLLFVVLTVIIGVVLIAAVVALLIAIASSLEDKAGSGAEQIVQVALAEEGTTDGSKYWHFTMGGKFSDGSSTPWCACFVSWCANECGYLDDGLFPKSGSVATYRRFFREKDQLHEEKTYVPKTGDLILFGSDEHIGIVQYTENGRVVTIEGNTSDAVHTRSYPLDSSTITGYCTPEYPEGKAVTIPDGMGTFHTYMGWRTVTSPTSLQYQLRESSGEHYDSEGFAKIKDRYVIACTTTYGKVGDYVDFYREDGSIIHAVIGDIKNQNDPGCNQYGHADGRCVVEYVVQQSTWYPSHANPGTSGCHPEWASRVVKAINLSKNYFD